MHQELRDDTRGAIGIDFTNHKDVKFGKMNLGLV